MTTPTGTARFPALDPEPPPLSRRSRLLRLTTGALVLTLLIGGLRWAWVTATASSPSAVQSARILAYSASAATLSITSVAHGTTTSYPSIGPVDGGLLAAPDGQTLISSSGRTVILKSGRPVSTNTTYFAALSNAAVVTDLADDGRYLVASAQGTVGSVSLVSTGSAVAHPLGEGDAVAGDPIRPALYVAVPGGDALPTGGGFAVSPDRSIEHRGIGLSTSVLTTATDVIARLHWPTAAPITLDPVPDPTGALVAVVAQQFTPPPSPTATPTADQALPTAPSGLAVYSTDGGLVGVRSSIATASATWSPDGRTLLYDSAPGRVVAWTPRTDASTDITLPAGIADLGRCAWSPDRVHAMCAGITAGPQAAIASWCLLDLRAHTATSFPRSSEPVLWESR